MKPIEPSQVPQREGVGDRRQFRPIVAVLGGLAVAAGVALMAFHHNPYAFIPSPAAVDWADPPSPPPPDAPGNTDQQPRRVCTHWDPTNNTTQDQPCDGPHST
jgi:hypothetical protein